MRGRLSAALVLAAALAVPAAAQIAMPDPSMIHGRALPAPELPDGTVSVRTVRESVGNNITGQAVTVTAAGSTRTGTTDAEGRAMLTGLPAGAEAIATAEVDGEVLESLPFAVPAQGGIRIILVAGIQAAADRKAREAESAAAAPPLQGTGIFGGGTRGMMAFRDDELRVFYLLEIVNTARGRVDIGGPLVLDLPPDAEQATILQGSTTSATVNGTRVTVVGPFQPGTTPLQVAFALPSTSATRTLDQVWPVRLEQVMVMVQKVPNLQVSSAQWAEQDEARAQNGTPFILGGGPGVAAGASTSVTLTGLPVHPAWPRNVALALAGVILLGGAWFAWSAGPAAAVDVRRLRERRESLLGELARLDEQHAAGRVDGSKYAARRHRLVADLEQVYAALDGAPGGGEAIAS